MNKDDQDRISRQKSLVAARAGLRSGRQLRLQAEQAPAVPCLADALEMPPPAGGLHILQRGAVQGPVSAIIAPRRPLDPEELQRLRATGLPLIDSDFIVDEYQIPEARVDGMSSFFLECGLLEVPTLQYFLEIGREYGMEAILSCGDGAALEKALATDARITGVTGARPADLTFLLERLKMKSPERLRLLLEVIGPQEIRALCHGMIRDMADTPPDGSGGGDRKTISDGGLEI